MAIEWLSVLKAVPWGDVISHAPTVADGARKLWGAVGRKGPAADVPADAAGATLGARAVSVDELQARLASAEAATAELHQQMLASSALIKDLAEQNAQLIVRIEAIRVRMRWLALATAAALGLAVWQLVLMSSR